MTKKKRIHNRWKWDDDKVLALLGTLESYKNEKWYSFVREGMAQLYLETDFGQRKLWESKKKT